MDAKDGTAAARRRKLFVLAGEIGLTRDERIELSRSILWRDIISWKHLSEAQVGRMLDALEGYEKIAWTLRNRATPLPGRDRSPGPAPDRK